MAHGYHTNRFPKMAQLSHRINIATNSYDIHTQCNAELISNEEHMKIGQQQLVTTYRIS